MTSEEKFKLSLSKKALKLFKLCTNEDEKKPHDYKTALGTLQFLAKLGGIETTIPDTVVIIDDISGKHEA